MRYLPRKVSGDRLQFGRYKVIEKLGAGGMGAVYRATALGVDGFEKPVVIKRIHGHLAVRPELLRRFINEAKISMGMAHGNVVQVLDLGKMDQEYFIALEYVDGRDLRDVLKRSIDIKEWLPQELSLHVVTQVLRGLDYAHRRTDSKGKQLGIVHRDITPANILCSFEGEVKLTDFGIARALAWAGATQAGAIRGSAKYMSPEQAWGHEIDQRSDIFSVGAVLYLLLCRAHPFVGESMFEILKSVREARFLPPAERGITLAEGLETVLLTAMAKEPDDRYPSASAMLAALENHQRTIPHATSSDLQALMQRLFETEIDTQTEVSADGLVGAQIEMSGNGDGGQDKLGVSVYSVANTSEPTTPATPASMQPIGGESPTLATEPDATLDDALTDAELQTAAGGSHRRWVGLGLVMVLLFSAGYGLVRLLTGHPPPPATGVLVVKTEPPGAEVTVDGKVVPGPSPTVISSAPRGRPLALQAKLPDHATATTRVTLEGPTHTVNLRLRRTIGQINLASSPAGAEVLVDDKPQGATPRRIKMTLGRALSVTVRHPGHAPWSRSLTLTDKRPEVTLEASLEPLPTTKNTRAKTPARRITRPQAKGWVRISTRPAYAVVYLRGRKLNTTPCRVQLPAGTHTLRLVNPTLEISTNRSVVVPANGEVELIVNSFGRKGGQRGRLDRARSPRER